MSYQSFNVYLAFKKQVLGKFKLVICELREKYFLKNLRNLPSRMFVIRGIRKHFYGRKVLKNKKSSFLVTQHWAPILQKTTNKFF